MNTRNRTFRGLLGAAAILAASAGTANAGIIIEIDFDLSTAAPDVTATELFPGTGLANAIYSDANGNFVNVSAESGAPFDGLLTDITFQANIQDGVAAEIRIFDDSFLLGSGLNSVTSHTTPTTVGPATTTLVTSIDGQVILDTGTLVQGNSSLQNTVIASLSEPSTIQHLITIVNSSGQVSTTTFDTTTQVPEPSMAALLGLGMLGFAAVRRRRLNG